MQTLLILFFAILSEVIGTVALKLSNGFTKPMPSVVVVIGYSASFYLLSLALKVMPIGVAYAIWSGVGLILTVIAGMILWRETLDWARVIGIILILVGIVFINVISKSPAH
ncbi:MAG TPA: multidrug efflux SMR transporter [Anaerolineales bacterium]|nr:multidrug efflux SMR transporter [Anaerolineales bacterium]HNQ94591.1 multidrug efflux SMR transporter [Anaerolineales bacterium]HNS60023.1 multidrug efflux SMR transporter [Anaerolineales bacterium]